MAEKMYSGQIIRGLESRHSNDVFIEECNTGSAHRGCSRMDAWAMKKSWSPFMTIGYEVKVTRSDFLRDDKWEGYRPYCHKLYFACPWKIIDPSELPDGIGLLWMNKGGRMVEKKKPHTVVPDPKRLEELMAYILMSRVRIVANGTEANGHNWNPGIDQWKEWLEGKKESWGIGQRVKAAIKKQVGDVQSENSRLHGENGRWEALSRKLKELGFDSTLTLTRYNIEAELERVRGVVPLGIIRHIRKLSLELTGLEHNLTTLRNDQGTEKEIDSGETEED